MFRHREVQRSRYKAGVRLWQMLAAIVGGASFVAGFAPFSIWVCAILSLAGVAMVVESLRRFRDAFAVGLLFGWAAFVGGYHWLRPALASFWEEGTALSWVVWLLWALVFCAQYALTWGVYHLLRRRGASRVWALPCAWVVVEFLYPSVFPVFVGNVLIDLPRWVQVARLGGPLLATTLVCVIAACVTELFFSVRKRAWPSRAAWVALAWMAIAVAYGESSVRRIRAHEQSADRLSISIVQANLTPYEKRRSPWLSYRRYVRESQTLEPDVAESDLLIWPETAYTEPIRDLEPVLRELANRVRRPVLTGAVTEEPEAHGAAKRFNAALLLDGEGKLKGRYRKHLLVPFAEYVPRPFGSVFADVFVATPFSPGEELWPLRFGTTPLAVSICYEAIRPRFIRRLVRATNPHVLVNLVNDAWFGDTSEPWLHLSLARMRAVEHGKPLIRAANTGVSAIIDATGRVVAATPLFDKATLRHKVAPVSEDTLYTQLGDWPGGVAIVGAIMLFRRRRKDALDSRGVL